MTGTFDISTFLTYYDGFIVAEPPTSEDPFRKVREAGAPYGVIGRC